jgi:hypothetical protein
VASVYAASCGTRARKSGFFSIFTEGGPHEKAFVYRRRIWRSRRTCDGGRGWLGVGPVGVGVTVGDGHRDYDRDRDRDRTTVIKEREPADRTTVIKKEHDDGVETKTIIHHDD